MRSLTTPLIVLALTVAGCGLGFPTDSDPIESGGAQEIFFNRQAGPGLTSDIMAIKSDGSGLRTVLNNAVVYGIRNGRMVWSRPRGDSVVVSALDGSGKTLLPGVDEWPVLSPDGGAVAWVIRAQDNHTLAVMPVASATPRILVRGLDYETVPSWSPDGTQIAFYRSDEAVCLVDVASGAVRVLDPDGYGFGDNRARISWSKDGQYLAYTGHHFPEGTDLFVIKADGTGRVQITDDKADELQPLLTPDGGTVIFSDETEAGLHLSRASRNGGAITDLTARFGGSIANVNHQITADGRQIVYSSFDDDADFAPGMLYVLDLGTGNARLVANSVWFGYWSGGMGY